MSLFASVAQQAMIVASTGVAGTTVLQMTFGNDANILVDDTGRHTPVVSIGTPATVEDSPFGGANRCMDAGSSTDAIRIPYSSDFDFEDGEFTIEYWAKRVSSGNDGSFVALADFTSPSELIWRVRRNRADMEFRYTLAGASTAILDTRDLNSGAWEHHAITRDASGVMRFFMGGTLRASVTAAGAFATRTKTDLYVGVPPGSGLPMHARLADLRITKGAALYTANYNQNDVAQLGVDAGVDPASIANVTRFYSAAKTVNVDDTLAQIWLDTQDSVIGHSSEEQPTFNGSVLTFANNRRMQFSTFEAENNVSNEKDWKGHIFLLRAKPTDTSGIEMLISSSKQNNQMRVNGSSVQFAASSGAYDNISSATGVFAGGTFYVFGFKAGTSEGRIWVDKTSVANTTLDIPSSYSVDQIGTRTASGRDYFEGDVSDFVILEETISDTDRESIIDYLNSAGATGSAPDTFSECVVWLKPSNVLGNVTSAGNAGSDVSSDWTGGDDFAFDAVNKEFIFATNDYGGNDVGSFPAITDEGHFYIRFKCRSERSVFVDSLQTLLRSGSTNDDQVFIDKDGFPSFRSDVTSYGSASFTGSASITYDEWQTLRVKLFNGSLELELNGSVILTVTASKGSALGMEAMGDLLGDSLSGSIKHCVFYKGTPTTQEDQDIKDWLATH